MRFAAIERVAYWSSSAFLLKTIVVVNVYFIGVINEMYVTKTKVCAGHFQLTNLCTRAKTLSSFYQAQLGVWGYVWYSYKKNSRHKVHHDDNSLAITDLIIVGHNKVPFVDDRTEIKADIALVYVFAYQNLVMFVALV